MGITYLKGFTIVRIWFSTIWVWLNYSSFLKLINKYSVLLWDKCYVLGKGLLQS